MESSDLSIQQERCITPPRDIRIPDGDAQIILFKQDTPPLPLEILGASLSSDEHDRMALFATNRLRQRYIVRRGVLRYLIGQWQGISPSDVRFSYGKFGKPYLDDTHHFNLSHSQKWAMIGLCHSPIGVDIEAMVATDDLGTITKTHFAQEEQIAWEALADNQRVEGFYKAWTRKEAFIKMDGRGLQIPLDSFAVTLNPHPDSIILRSNIVDATDWCMWDLSMSEGFAGAMVTEKQIRKVRILLW